MYIPLVREHVRLQGCAGEFLVLRADYVRQVADLAGVADSYPVRENVPFASLFALFEEANPVRNPPQRSDSASDSEARSRSAREA